MKEKNLVTKTLMYVVAYSFATLVVMVKLPMLLLYRGIVGFSQLFYNRKS